MLAALIVAGCGAEDHPNDPRPPAPVELSAKVGDKRVVLAPSRTGAGLAVVTISNQSSENVQLEFSGPSHGETSEIAAGGVGTVQLQLKEGDYSVEPSSPSIQAGTLAVGPERPSAQNDLLLP
jgi:hypothetical protein